MSKVVAESCSSLHNEFELSLGSPIYKEFCYETSKQVLTSLGENPKEACFSLLGLQIAGPGSAQLGLELSIIRPDELYACLLVNSTKLVMRKFM